MKPRRLRWQSDRRRAALSDRLQLEVTAWLDGWSVAPAALGLRESQDEVSGAVAGVRWLRAQGNAGTLLFAARAAMIDGLGGLLANAAARDDLELGRRVGDRALRDLLTRLAGGATAQAEIADGAAPNVDELQPRFGSCAFVLEGSGFEARLWLDDALCERWLPTASPPQEALAPRDATLKKEMVEFDVVLDLGQGLLSETIGMQVGDVIATGAPIDSLFHLIHPSARRLASGRLFRHGDQRALQLDAALPPRKSS